MIPLDKDGRAFIFTDEGFYSCKRANPDWWLYVSERTGSPKEIGPFRTIGDVVLYSVNNREEFGLYEIGANDVVLFDSKFYL